MQLVLISQQLSSPLSSASLPTSLALRKPPLRQRYSPSPRPRDAVWQWWRAHRFHYVKLTPRCRQDHLDNQFHFERYRVRYPVFHSQDSASGDFSRVPISVWAGPRRAGKTTLFSWHDRPPEFVSSFASFGHPAVDGAGRCHNRHEALTFRLMAFPP